VSIDRRSGWLAAAPNDPASWKAAMAAAVSHSLGSRHGPTPGTVRVVGQLVIGRRAYAALRRRR
jgi:hypothetical protein